MTGNNNSIVVPEKVVPANLNTNEEQLEKWSISLDEGGCNLHPAVCAYNFPYCSVSAVFSSVPDWLPSGNPVLQVQGLKGELSVDQVTGGIHKYDHDNKLFISLGKKDYDIA